MDEAAQNLLPIHCSDWSQDEARVVAVLSLGQREELWIGEEYSDDGGLGVVGLQRMYEIEDFSKSGPPLQGSIKVRLPTPEMDVERVCFRKLIGLQVRGDNSNEDGVYGGDRWSMTITAVEFGTLVRPAALQAEKVPTGETQALLKMSEGLAAMALRKSVEHLWALPGSFALMVAWAVLALIWRRMSARSRVQCVVAVRSAQSQLSAGGSSRVRLWTSWVAARIARLLRCLRVVGKRLLRRKRAL